ncbi:MAG: TIGR03915 family putative DNA repair protein [Segetibacter sp.]
MITVVYDGSFKGLLTAIFEVFDFKLQDVVIAPQHESASSMFGPPRNTITDEVKAGRVWKGLLQKISAAALSQLYYTFLSEQKGIENSLLQYVQYVFANNQTIEQNFAHPAVLTVIQTSKKVRREKHRMEAFVRFQLTKDQLYYAICQPDYNVLPLIGKHFKDRYANQRWLIYDSRRKYGIYYDLENVESVLLSFSGEANNGENIAAIFDDSEELYQQLWQQYFTSVNIAARKNTKLHIQHMPKRYWRYLPEKQPFK